MQYLLDDIDNFTFFTSKRFFVALLSLLLGCSISSSSTSISVCFKSNFYARKLTKKLREQNFVKRKLKMYSKLMDTERDLFYRERTVIWAIAFVLVMTVFRFSPPMTNIRWIYSKLQVAPLFVVEFSFEIHKTATGNRNEFSLFFLWWIFILIEILLTFYFIE